MKRVIAAMITMLALLPLAALASESFTLSIPQRFDASQEIGEVRILLCLNAAPAGSQLVVNGATTLALGATQTIAGDSVSFTAATGNCVMIKYRPLSNFAGDFCSGGGATSKDIPLRFVGAQDVVEYRMSSFVVGAPMAECSDVSRRIADMPATIAPVDDGVAPALSANFLGRLALDVILVLDKSGSMGDLPPGAAAGPTKAAILKSAVDAFVANWRQVDAPNPPLNWAEDRLGVVMFDSVATPQTLAGADPPANFFMQRGSSAVPGPWDAVISSVDSLTPGGSTSVGGGVNAAMQQWKADPAHDATLIVVTDGIQNTAPLITIAPSGFLTLAPVSGLPAELRQRFIPIQSIGFGLPAAVDEALLRDMSLETAGRSYISVDASTLFDTFAMTLVSILKGNTASVATRFSSTLTGPGPSATRSVIVDKSARRVVFSLQWAPPLRDVLDLEVFRPGTTTPATPTRAEKLPQTAIQAFDLDKIRPGTWGVRVIRNPRTRETFNDPVPYNLNVFFLERHLDYRLSLQPLRVKTGKPLTLRAEISYDGKPLTGLPAGAIRVKVLRPTVTLETVLRETKDTLKRPGGSGDPQTELQRAINALPASAVARLAARPSETLTLREEKRGIYAITMGKTALPGSYVFEVVLDWDDARTGHVHREERVEALVSDR